MQVKAHRTAFFLSDMTTINFYSYNGHPNTVNKQLGEFTAIEGDLRQTFDVLRPTVTLRKQPRPTFNYCYIPDLGRYYFVERVSFEGTTPTNFRCVLTYLRPTKPKFWRQRGVYLKVTTPTRIFPTVKRFTSAPRISRKCRLQIRAYSMKRAALLW